MNDLFERYASIGGEVQAYLNSLNTCMQEGRLPGEGLVQKLNDSLSRLSDVRAEITARAASAMPGFRDPGEDASIDLYQRAWEDYCSRHNQICAMLAEFLRVYSDESRYMSALQPVLSHIEQIVDASTVDQLTSKEIDNIGLFLRGVKELPASRSEDLIHEIEDSLYGALNPISVSGLLLGKYALRRADEDAPSDRSVEASSVSEAVASADAAICDEAASVPKSVTDEVVEVCEEDDVSEPSSGETSPADEPDAVISPRRPIAKAAVPSEQKLKETVRYCFPVLHYLLKNLGFAGLLERTQLETALFPEISGKPLDNILDRLEQKGFLAIYAYEGQTILAFTKLMSDCLGKKSVVKLLRRFFPNLTIPKVLPFTANNLTDKAEFVCAWRNSKLYFSFLDRLNTDSELLTLFPISYNPNGRKDGTFRIELHREGCEDQKLRLVPADTFAAETCDEDDGVICEADDLFALDMSAVADDAHYCVADQAYRWQSGQWLPLSTAIETPADEKADTVEGAASDAPFLPDVIVAAEETHSLPPAEEDASADTVSLVETESNVPFPDYGNVFLTESDSGIETALQQETGVDIAQKVSNYRDVAIRCAIQGRADVASVILRSLANYDAKGISQTLRRFALATGDPAYHGSRSVSGIQEVFDLPSGDDPAYDLLSASAHLRMFFSSAASDNPYLAHNIIHLQNSFAYRRYAQLNKVFFQLSSFVEKQQRGMDAFLLEKVGHSNQKSSIAQSLKKQADDILAMRLTESNHGNKQLKKNREFLFGKESDIYKALKIIQDGKDGKPLPSEFSTIPDVDEYIDSFWEKAARDLGFGRTEPCTGGERKTLSRHLQNIFSLFESYAQLTNIHRREKDGQVEAAIHSLEAIRSSMEDILSAPCAAATEPPEVCAADAVLRRTIRDCLSRISGEADEASQQRAYYIELLKEPLVALESMTEPYIEQRDEEIFPFDFCERAAQYLSAPSHDWDSTVSRLLNNRSATRDGMDYGSLKILSAYLSETGHPELAVDEKQISEKIAQAQSRDNIIALGSFHLWQQDFDARLELADGDGWFESDLPAKVQFTNSLRRQYESYVLLDNYGFYGRAMLRVLQRLDEKASELCSRYSEELSRLKNGRSEEELSHPIFEQIRHMIEAKRFGAAESYMQLVRSNYLDIDEGGLQKGHFDAFISELNGNLYRSAKQDRDNKPLSQIYDEKHRGGRNSQYRSGVDLLRFWPNSQPSDERVKSLMSGLGLDVKSVEKKNSGQFTVLFHEPKGMVDYPHPIAAFGSKMYRYGLDVCYIDGKRDDEALIGTISEKVRPMHGNRQLLILANFAVSLDIRRKLAASLNRSFSGKCVILIDRCLILFLADVFKSERWKVALRCALPFCVINPYFEDSKLEIPPEMFIGRQDEIRSIISPDGHNLLSGGRQLGKTAILQRARFQQDNPAEHSWAVYVDIKDKDYAQSSESICKSLRYDGFFADEQPDTSDWNALMDLIECRLMGEQHQEDKLLLLLDEADQLLKMIGDDGYKAFERLKELQQITGGRFKFVMAGLHNVLRFSRDSLSGDSILPHFSCLAIEPLKFTDARELLEKPLSYLGFTIEPGQEDIIAQILYNTNYFPGLIQFYASSLIKNMLNNASPLKNPPYRLTRDVLLRLLSEREFRKLRRDRLLMTLTVDEKDTVSYYFVLANALAYCSYQDDDIMLNGATAGEIRSACLELHPQCSLSSLTDKQVEELLEELVRLNILRPESDRGRHRYLFSRSSFLEMLGDQSEVEDSLIASLEKGANTR